MFPLYPQADCHAREWLCRVSRMPELPTRFKEHLFINSSVDIQCNLDSEFVYIK